MDRRRLWILGGIALLIATVAAVFALSSTLFPRHKAERDAAAEERRETPREADLCAAAVTYDRLKTSLFADAARLRGATAAGSLDRLAADAVVRMESPVLKGSDEAAGTTDCAGRIVIELPPGAERGLDGVRRLQADIGYSAQRSADDSGLVWTISGGEAIVQALARFDAAASPAETMLDPAAQIVPPSTLAPPPVVPGNVPSPPPPAPPAPPEAPRPSFDCADAGTRSEIAVCESPGLAALDRRMAAAYEQALADGDRDTRRALARSRDRFLDYRERCRSEACIADAYRGRMLEIRDIAEGR